MAIGAAHVGMFGAEKLEGASRELTAIGRAREWLNSPRLTPETLAGKVEHLVAQSIQRLPATAYVSM